MPEPMILPVNGRVLRLPRDHRLHDRGRVPDRNWRGRAQRGADGAGSVVAGVRGKVGRELSADEVTYTRANAQVYGYLSDLHRNPVE